MVLNMGREIEDVIYFVHYIVLDSPKAFEKYFAKKDVVNFSSPKESRKNRANIRKLIKEEILPKIKKGAIDYDRAIEYSDRLRDSDLPFDIYEVFTFINKYTHIRFGIGAEAIRELLQQVDIKAELAQIKRIIDPSKPNFSKLSARSQILN
jgi:DNA-directed RNA polymerase subunit beta'